MENAPVADRTSTVGTALPTVPDINASDPSADAGAPPAWAAANGCPVDHTVLAGSQPSAATNSSGACPVDHNVTAAIDASPPAAPLANDAVRCPVPHIAAATAAGCPIPHRQRPAQRSKADLVIRRVLRIKERPTGVGQREVYAAFQKSMLISATRCTLTYVVFPFVLPAIGIALEGLIGVLVGSVAMVADVFTIRRFFAVDHNWRWYLSAIVFGIMCLLTALLIQDLSHLLA